jgi:hypothetical protein
MAEIVNWKRYAESYYLPMRDDKYCLFSGNMEGRYVRESDYAALMERHRRLVSAARKAYSDWDGNTHEEECKSMRRLGTALAEEVDDGRTTV